MIDVVSVALLPFDAIDAPALLVEETALSSHDKKLIRIAAIRGQVGIGALIIELRYEQRIRTCNVSVLDGCHVSTLVQIWSGRLRVKRIQPEIISLLRVQGERRCN